MSSEQNQEQAVVIEATGEHLASVIWLHGLGADGHDFEPIVPELGLEPARGVRFIFPHAPMRPVTINGGMTMRAWCDVQSPDLTQMQDSEGIRAAGQQLHDWIDAEIGKGVPSHKVVAAGFSQGGAVALHGGLRYPQPLGGILALSCYLPLADRLEAEAREANIRTPILMMHGTNDPIIPVGHGHASRDQLIEAGYDVNWREYPMAHAVSMEEIGEIAEWLDRLLA